LRIARFKRFKISLRYAIHQRNSFRINMQEIGETVTFSHGVCVEMAKITRKRARALKTGPFAINHPELSPPLGGVDCIFIR
jgi:hypothetical protein